MRIIFLYLLTLTTYISFGQVSNDTITNWQIYKDSELLLRGNIVMENALLPVTILNLNDEFDNIEINFFYDFHSDKLERKIEFSIENKQIREFINFDSTSI